MKKLLAILMVFITVLFSACSKESKFGIQQFTERMNKTFETDYKTSDFVLSKRENENVLFLSEENSLISVFIDNNNYIKGVSLLITADGDIENAKNTYCQMCSIFTGNDYESQMKIFSESDFFNEDIKFADGNSLITVGRYKYTVVCNDYSITFFCERV
ncbi:MAG: hypothetical protein IJB72_03005 [Clostridia bacterium]|nr:hypothetical protein [Clostridia bacterium]